VSTVFSNTTNLESPKIAWHKLLFAPSSHTHTHTQSPTIVTDDGTGFDILLDSQF